jgi:glucan phosphorylase
LKAAVDPDLGERIAFVEEYGEQLAQYLVHGVDVWLNNPLPPVEASGTSGMKAAPNGVPPLSIMDGWWAEGFNGKNGWAFVSKKQAATGIGQMLRPYMRFSLSIMMSQMMAYRTAGSRS